MDTIKAFWQRLTPAKRVSLMLLSAGILAGLVAMTAWMLRTDYRVLFSALSAQDSAAMVAELDRLKIPYRVDDQTQSLLVPTEAVASTRLKLMSRDLQLQGAVGFELFNNSDFGMTEFAQKVNYQRALQGELTRTILAIDAVQTARVHLAMPEQGLFRKAQGAGKASVTLTLRPGQELSNDQVAGIQRLVAASVTDIQPTSVMVVNQRGEALSGSAGDGEVDLSAAHTLRLKRNTEDYLTRKVSAVLERALGPDEAVVAVDVTLNLDQTRVTTEEILAAKNPTPDTAPAGVVVRERQNTQEAVPPGDATVSKAQARSSQSIEVDYQTGKRVEQSVVTPGSLKSLSVVVVVKQALDAAKVDQLREIAAAAVGLNRQRGDAITVQAMPAIPPSRSTPPDDKALPYPDTLPRVPTTADPPGAEVVAAVLQSDKRWWLLIGIGLLLLIFRPLWRRSRARQEPLALSGSQRERALINVQDWLQLPHAPATQEHRSHSS